MDGGEDKGDDGGEDKGDGVDGGKDKGDGVDGGEDNGDDGCNSFLLVSKFAFWTNPCTQQLLCIKGFIWPHNHLF